MQGHAPVLHDFLAWEMAHHSDQLPRSAIRLLKGMLDLAEAAYIPASVESYKSCKRRAPAGPDLPGLPT